MKDVIIILALMLALPILSVAQEPTIEEIDVESLTPYTKNSQFGIMLELNSSKPTIEQNDLSSVGLTDQINGISPESDLGIGIGILYGYEFNDFVTVRTQAMLSFLKSKYQFDLNEEFNKTLTRETVNIEVPVHLVLEKVNKKVSPSAVIGARYRHNIAQNTLTSKLTGNYNSSDIMFDAGAGLSFQIDNFRFKTELLYSRGLLDQVGENTPRSLASALKNSTNNQLSLRFMFYM